MTGLSYTFIWQSSGTTFVEFCTYRKRRHSCAPYVGEYSPRDVQQIKYGGRNRKQKYITFQLRDRCSLKADKFVSDANYIILCLTRELDMVPCHCQYGSCNRSNMAAQTRSTYICGTRGASKFQLQIWGFRPSRIARPSDHNFHSVFWFVYLSVCLYRVFSAVFDPISIKLGHMLHVWV